MTKAEIIKKRGDEDKRRQTKGSEEVKKTVELIIRNRIQRF